MLESELQLARTNKLRDAVADSWSQKYLDFLENINTFAVKRGVYITMLHPNKYNKNISYNIVKKNKNNPILSKYFCDKRNGLETVTYVHIEFDNNITLKEIISDPNIIIDNTYSKFTHVTLKLLNDYKKYIAASDYNLDCVDYYLTYFSLSRNLSLPQKFVEDNIDKNWDWNSLIMNPNLETKFIDKHKERFNTCEKHIYWFLLSAKKNIEWEYVQKHILKPWDWSQLTKNIHIDIILSNIHRGFWQLCMLSENITLQEKHIPELIFMDIKINWSSVSINKNITWEYIANNTQYPWDWDMVSKKSNVTFDIIQNNLELGLSYAHYLRNENITLNEFEICFKEIKGVCKDIYTNDYDNGYGCCGYERNYYDFYCTDYLPKCDKERNEFIISNYRIHLAAYLIQQAWKNARINPYTELGKRKINRDYDEMYGSEN